MHKNAQLQDIDLIQKNEKLEWEIAALRAERDALVDELTGVKRRNRRLQQEVLNLQAVAQPEGAESA